MSHQYKMANACEALTETQEEWETLYVWAERKNIIGALERGGVPSRRSDKNNTSPEAYAPNFYNFCKGKGGVTTMTRPVPWCRGTARIEKRYACCAFHALDYIARLNKSTVEELLNELAALENPTMDRLLERLMVELVAVLKVTSGT